MAYDGWIEFGGREFINVARTSRLARTLGLNTVRIRQEIIGTIQSRFYGDGFGLGGFGITPFGETPAGAADSAYVDITQAPWYDAGFPASAEFAGIVPLSFQGLDDSTLTSSPVEYITDGGHSGKPRNATLTIVANVALVALTERGAEYGKRWMDRLLRGSGSRVFCVGADLRYLRYLADDAPIVHRRDVRLTRGSSVTRKKVSGCSSTWLATFTLVAGDSYEYGSPISQITALGGTVATGNTVVASGGLDLVEQGCPEYDYSPIYDPLYPALIASPTAPEFLPDGWGIDDGMTFHRKWARLSPFEPSPLAFIPQIAVTSPRETRTVRFCIWPSDADPSDVCGALFTAIMSYLPAGKTFYIDSEQQASYVWNGRDPAVRRTDSLLYGPNATPIQWATLSDPDGLLVTLDTFTEEPSVRAALQFVPKSD